MLKPVTDPDILNKAKGLQSSRTERIKGLVPVTDPVYHY